MPKPVKLHSKGKPNSIQKANKSDKDNNDNKDPEEATREFQLQLCWCIQQLERSLREKKGNEKHCKYLRHFFYITLTLQTVNLIKDIFVTVHVLLKVVSNLHFILLNVNI